MLVAAICRLNIDPGVNRMYRPIETLADEELNLSTADRARLLDRVVESLDADRRRDEAWDALAARRRFIVFPVRRCCPACGPSWIELFVCDLRCMDSNVRAALVEHRNRDLAYGDQRL